MSIAFYRLNFKQISDKKEGECVLFDKIKAICQEKGMSISLLERTAGLGNGTIDGWNTSSPRLENILAVAKVLGVPLSELVGGEDE